MSRSNHMIKVIRWVILGYPMFDDFPLLGFQILHRANFPRLD